MNNSSNGSHIRRFILLTLSHAERADRQMYTPHFVTTKVRGLFSCDQIVVSRETHAEGGYHYHVGILNCTASVHTATKVLRKAFSEFDGRQLNVSFHKSWKTILKYCLKHDMNPNCWNTSAEECRRHVGSKSSVPSVGISQDYNKSSSSTTVKLTFLDKLLSYNSWDEALLDKSLLSEIAPKIASYKQTFFEYKRAVAESPLPFAERLNAKLEILLPAVEELSPYTPEEVGENIYSILEWLAKNLSLERESHDPQLFIVGETSLGKTRLFKLLEESEVCNFYQMDEMLEFSGASNFTDGFVFDEFSLDLSNVGSTIRLLNKIADGQKVKLNVKYGFFLKTRNVGVILISNDYPKYPSRVSKRTFDAFLRRFELVNFDREVRWDMHRLLLTLKILVDRLLVKKLSTGLQDPSDKNAIIEV